MIRCGSTRDVGSDPARRGRRAPQLSSRERAAFVLRHMEGMPIERIAEVLKIGPNAVSRRFPGGPETAARARAARRCCMTHVSDQDLAFYATDSELPPAIREHISACSSCRATPRVVPPDHRPGDRAERLRANDSYGRDVWRVSRRTSPGNSASLARVLRSPAARFCRSLRARARRNVSRRPVLESRTARSPVGRSPGADSHRRARRAPRAVAVGPDRARQRARRFLSRRDGRAGAGERPRRGEPSLSSDREPVGRPRRRDRAGGARATAPGRRARAVATVARGPRHPASTNRNEGRSVQGTGHWIEHAERSELPPRSPRKERHRLCDSLVPLLLRPRWRSTPRDR